MCGRFFIAPSVFDRHVTIDKHGKAGCRDPATIKTRDGRPVLEEHDGWWTTCRNS
jgi:hypothetical protein